MMRRFGAQVKAMVRSQASFVFWCTFLTLRARQLSSCSAAQAGREHGCGSFAGCLGVVERKVNVLEPLALAAKKRERINLGLDL